MSTATHTSFRSGGAGGVDGHAKLQVGGQSAPGRVGQVVERRAELVKVDGAGHHAHFRGLHPRSLMGLEVAHAGQHDVAFRNGRQSWDARPLSTPASAREHGQGHHVEVAGHVVVGGVQVCARVWPHHSKPVAADPATVPRQLLQLPARTSGNAPTAAEAWTL